MSCLCFESSSIQTDKSVRFRDTAMSKHMPFPSIISTWKLLILGGYLSI